MARKSTLSPEQRSQLVVRLLSKEEPAVQIARRAGISEQTLYHWRDEFIGAGRQAINGPGAQAEHAKTGERRTMHTMLPTDCLAIPPRLAPLVHFSGMKGPCRFTAASRTQGSNSVVGCNINIAG